MVEIIEGENKFHIEVDWANKLDAKIYEADHNIILKITSKRKGFSFYFDSFSEVEEFVLKNFVSLEALVRGLSLKTLDGFDETKIPCLAYHDSKYNFERARGGWHIRNPAHELDGFYNPVGSISRAKYGSGYWLRLGDLIVYSDPDLSSIKKVAVELLNGKKDIYDTMYAWQSGFIGGNLSYLTKKSE